LSADWQAKKGFPLLSRSPSAENLYSSFTEAEIDEKIDEKIEEEIETNKNEKNSLRLSSFTSFA
jgi:hypothetical protein